MKGFRRVIDLIPKSESLSFKSTSILELHENAIDKAPIKTKKFKCSCHKKYFLTIQRFIGKFISFLKKACFFK